MSEELEARLRVRVDGKDELAGFFRSARAGAKEFGDDVGKSLKRAGDALSYVSGKAKSELAAFAGKELGGSIGAQARGVLELRDAINQLAVSAGGGQDLMADLNKQIQDVSVSSNQLQGDVTAAMQAFVERTGDLKTARDNLALYGKVATATSASMEDVARVGVELKTKLDITDQAKAFGIITAQAKAGAIEMKDFATKAPRMFASIASAGGKGEVGLREAGAMAQVYAQAFGGTGTPASVATAIENTFASMAKKRGQLEAKGIKFVDDKGQNRDRFETLFDIIRATKGDETKLREVFTQQGMRGVNVLAQEYRTTGKFGTFEKFKGIQADQAQMDRDFAMRASSGVNRLKQQEAERTRFVNTYFGGAIEFAAGHASQLQYGAVGLGLAGKGLGLLGRGLGGIGGVTGRLGSALGAATAQRVFVVNWPGGLGGGSIPGAGGVGLLGAAGQLLGAGAVGVTLGAAAGNYLDKHSTTARKFYEGEAKLLGKLTGQEGKIAGIEAAGREEQRLKNARAEAHRRDLILDFEMKNLSANMDPKLAHGLAINAADQQIKAEISAVNVTINGNEATAEAGGTRSPAAIVRRNGGSAEMGE